MINVGEQTGGLDEMLSKIADFYDDEVDNAVASLTSILEPVMIVVMGVVIGGMVVAMYMPMFDMINAGSGSRRCNKRVKASCAGELACLGCTRAASVPLTTRGEATRNWM